MQIFMYLPKKAHRINFRMFQFRMPELQDSVYAAHLWTTAFLAPVSIVQLIESLGRPLKNLAKHIPASIQSSPHAARSKFTQKFSIVQNFCSFYFRMQNAHAKYVKISTIQKFPTIRYVPAVIRLSCSFSDFVFLCVKG